MAPFQPFPFQPSGSLYTFPENRALRDSTAFCLVPSLDLPLTSSLHLQVCWLKPWKMGTPFLTMCRTGASVRPK